MHLTGDPVLAGQTIYESSATARHGLGDRMVTVDGRVFRYAQAGASALVAGNLLQAPAQITTHQQLTPTAAALGALSITVTLGATAATANQYAGGWAIIDTTPGLGYAYPISGHAAADASAAVELHLTVPIQVALTTASRVSLQANPYAGVIANPTTMTSAAVGVAPFPIAASEYGWIQRGGAAGVLIEGTPGEGLPVGPNGTTAGAVGTVVTTTTTAIPAPIVGTMLVQGVDGKVQAVMLNLE